MERQGAEFGVGSKGKTVDLAGRNAGGPGNGHKQVGKFGANGVVGLAQSGGGAKPGKIGVDSVVIIFERGDDVVVDSFGSGEFLG